MKLDLTHAINFCLFMIGGAVMYAIFTMDIWQSIRACLVIAVAWEVYQYFARLHDGKPTYFLQSLLDIVSMVTGGSVGTMIGYFLMRTP
jgi:hypothetical protein